MIRLNYPYELSLSLLADYLLFVFWCFLDATQSIQPAAQSIDSRVTVIAAGHFRDPRTPEGLHCSESRCPEFLERNACAKLPSPNE